MDTNDRRAYQKYYYRSVIKKNASLLKHRKQLANDWNNKNRVPEKREKINRLNVFQISRLVVTVSFD